VHDGATLAARTIRADTTLTAVTRARCDAANALASVSASLASAARTNPGAREGRLVHGLPILEAAVEASRLRFRPILMTSFWRPEPEPTGVYP